MDPELREALDQLRGEIQTVGTDLRAEVRAGDAETRTYVEERLQTSSAGLLHQMGSQVGEQIRGQIRESEDRMRRHFDVVGESLRSDIRAIAEGMAAYDERLDRRVDEHGVRTDGLDDRMLRLEVRVKRLEDGRKPRRARRGR